MTKLNSILVASVLILVIVILFSYAYLNRERIPIDVYITKAEAKAPFNHISEEQINVFTDRAVILIDEPKWARFAGTKSMVPVLDEDTNAIQIVPIDIEQIHAGDIVSYNSNYANKRIIHRIIKISEDENGWYAIIKGDNNLMPDPGRIRFNQIQRVTVGILY